MAAGRLQRWAIFLSGFDYTCRHIKGEDNGAADGLSRFPIDSEKGDENGNDYFYFLVKDKIPISRENIITNLRTDKILSKDYQYTRDGWPSVIPQELKPYRRRSLELSIYTVSLGIGNA